MKKFSESPWEEWGPFLDPGHHPTPQEIQWRMRGILDCLKLLKKYGEIDPKYVEYLVEKTGEKVP